jgi:CBS domain-containing protein
VWRLRDLDLDPAPGDDSAGPVAPEDASLRDALSLMLVEGTERLGVADEDGRVKGSVTLHAITRLIGPDERADSA